MLEEIAVRERLPSWIARGSCRTAEPELFFPVGESALSARDVQRAKAICTSCPVLSACREFALRVGEPDGIWGGLTPPERRFLRNR